MIPDHRELRALFDDPPASDSFREAEAAAARWVWTRGGSDRWHAEPLWATRRGLRVGRDFKQPPRRRDDVERYGYDASDRLRYAERFAGGQQDGHLLVERRGDLEIRWNLDSLGLLSTLTCASVDAASGRIDATAVISKIGSEEVFVEERFEYNAGGRLCCVRFDRSGGDYEQWRARRKGEQRLGYDERGELVEVTVHYDDPAAEPEIVYQRVVEGWDELASDIVAPLGDSIADAVAARDREPALVAITYPVGDISLPPQVFVCPRERWHELIATAGHQRWLLMPAEWRTEPLELTLPEPLAETCTKINALATRGEVSTAAKRDLIFSLARRVADREPPDVAVYAVDIDGEDLERNVKVSVSGATVASWKADGMLEPQ